MKTEKKNIIEKANKIDVLWIKFLFRTVAANAFDLYLLNFIHFAIWSHSFYWTCASILIHFISHFYVFRYLVFCFSILNFHFYVIPFTSELLHYITTSTKFISIPGSSIFRLHLNMFMYSVIYPKTAIWIYY